MSFYLKLPKIDVPSCRFLVLPRSASWPFSNGLLGILRCPNGDFRQVVDINYLSGLPSAFNSGSRFCLVSFLTR